MNSEPGKALLRVLTKRFAGFDGNVVVLSLEQTDWASVTFSGARHRVHVGLDGPGAVGAAADFLKDLPDLDLPLPGHVVADLNLIAEERRCNGRYAGIELEALTIEDR